MTNSVNASSVKPSSALHPPPSALGPGRAPSAERREPSRRLAQFGWLAFLVFAGTQVAAVLMSPPDRMMGHLQKILYVHVPTAWAGLVAYAVVFVASILYLWKRNERHDRLALAAAEAGTLMTAVTLVLGSLWGKPTWGVWWTWDPRLTTTAIMLMIYAGYLALRAFVEDPEQAARWSAAVGILGFVNVPIVYMSVRWWRTLHQVQSSMQSTDPRYRIGWALNALSILLVLGYLVARRMEVLRLERAAEDAADARALGVDGLAAPGATR